jgi:hypothetical protein
MSLIGNLGLGFGSSGGGTCDYPSQDNVRNGTAYAFGTMVGDIVLPPTGDVLIGIGYGANATELFGTYVNPTFFPPPSGNWPLQAASYEQILDAIRIQLAKYTGLALERIREWYADTRPSYGDDPLVTFRPMTDTPFLSAGAGRLGTKMDFAIEITVWYRLQQDDAGTHRQWGRSAFALRRAVISAMHDHNVFNQYDPVTGDPVPGALPLTTTPFQYVPSQDEDKGPVMTDGRSVMNFVSGAVVMVLVPNLTS